MQTRFLRLTTLIAVVGWIAGADVVLAAPATSHGRAAQLREWRETLRRAETAYSEQRPEAAERWFTQVYEETGSAAPRHLFRARAADGLGDLRRDAGRFEEAIEHYVQAAELWSELLGPRQPRLATTWHNLGMVYIELGRFDEAREVLQPALVIWRMHFGEQSGEARNTERALELIRTRAAAQDPAASETETATR